MTSIRPIRDGETTLVQDLAWRIWNAVYVSLISQEQIEYMLMNMYSPAALQAQIDAGHQFWIAEEGSRPVGFMSVSVHPVIPGRARIHKLYLLPSAHGQGIGKQMLEKAYAWARQRKLGEIELNVNRGNPARFFYERNGFRMVRMEDLKYGKFWLNDFLALRQL